MLTIILQAVAVIFLFSLAMGLSWIATCGIIKLITLCFGLTFSWGIATGIWLILILLGEIFGKSRT